MQQSKFGLVGKNISYSFSKEYFTEKFQKLGLKNTVYENFDIVSEDALKEFLDKQATALVGFNVTIPYKEVMLKYVDKLHKKAKKTGAVNTVKISKKGKKTGYNTDVYGFKKAITPMLEKHHKKALILGTGGASKAVAYVLKKKGIKVVFVSRKKQGENIISYKQLSEEILKTHTIIVNCTPLGTFPKVEEYPKIPFQFIGKQHLLFDLIYNPKETVFLQKGKKQGAQIQNGLKMLQFQAEKAWKIWNDS